MQRRNAGRPQPGNDNSEQRHRNAWRVARSEEEIAARDRLSEHAPRAARDRDGRERTPSAVFASETHAALVLRLESIPREMRSMLEVAWQFAAELAAAYRPDPFRDLAKALEACRAEVQDEASHRWGWLWWHPDQKEVREQFEAHASAIEQLLADNAVIDEPNPRLSQQQHFVWLASAFARNQAIVEFMGPNGVSDIRKSQERLRAQGLDDDTSVRHFESIVARELRRFFGVDADPLSLWGEALIATRLRCHPERHSEA